MSTFTELCIANRAEDDLETAHAVLVALKVRGEAANVLLPLVANSVRLVLRADAREIEWSVMNHVDGIEGGYTYQDFLRQSFALFDGRRVRWADATVEDHEMRITMLTAMRDGLNVTIARHRAAVDQLRKTGAKCLGALAGATT